MSYTPEIALVRQRNEIGIIDSQAEFEPLAIVDRNKDEDEFLFNTPKHNGYFINDLAFISYQDGDTERYCVVNRQGKLLVSSKVDSFKQRKMDNSLYQIVAGQKPDYDLSKAVETLSDRDSKSSRKEYGFNSGLFQISINGRNAYVNLDSELVPWLEEFDRVGNFSEGLAPFVKDNRYSFVTSGGKVAFYLDPDLVAANYSSKHSNHYIRGVDWVFYPEQFIQFENGLAKVKHMNIDSLESEWDCPAYDQSPLGYAYIDKTGKTVKYEPIIHSLSGGSEGNYQSVDCDLRVVNY